MNCKQGDLAIILYGPAAGLVVTCLEALAPGFQRDDLPAGVEQQIDESSGPLWRIDRAVEWGDLLYLHLVPDNVLMPIGRGPGMSLELVGEHHTAEAC
jgi:hypothetical protein